MPGFVRLQYNEKSHRKTRKRCELGCVVDAALVCILDISNFLFCLVDKGVFLVVLSYYSHQVNLRNSSLLSHAQVALSNYFSCVYRPELRPLSPETGLSQGRG